MNMYTALQHKHLKVAGRDRNGFSVRPIGLERSIVQVFARCGIAKLRELLFGKDFWEND
jgi:hypothetical protein